MGKPCRVTFGDRVFFKPDFIKRFLDTLHLEDNVVEESKYLKSIGYDNAFNEGDPMLIREKKAEAKAEAVKESGFSPDDNIFNKPELKNNKTHGWRTMSESEFNSLSTGEKTYEGGKPKSGNWIAGVPQSAAKFGKKGTVMVEFGGINMMGAENMEEGTTADKSNVTKVWRFNEDTNQFEEASDLLQNVKDGKAIEIGNKKQSAQEKQAEIQKEVDDIQDNQIPELTKKLYEAPVAPGGEVMVSDILELQRKERKIYTIKEAVDAYFEKLTKYIEEPVTKEELIDDYLTKEQKAIIDEIQKLEERSSDLENEIGEIEDAEEQKLKTPKVEAKAEAKAEVNAKDVESTAKALEKVGNIDKFKKLLKSFSINDVKQFFHASGKKRKGKLYKGVAPQFGEGVYFSTNKDLVVDEFGDNVTEVALTLKNPVFTNTKEWKAVERKALELADEDYGKKNGLKLEEGETYFRYDKDNTSDVGEINPIFISKAAEQLGYDAIIDKNSNVYDNEISVLDDSRIVYEEDMPMVIAEEYHRAKADGSNPELVKAVDELLGKQPQATETSIFDDFDSTNKGKSIKSKAEANKAFKEKYGEDAAVAKAISSNFEAIADELKAKGIFTKIKC